MEDGSAGRRYHRRSVELVGGSAAPRKRGSFGTVEEGEVGDPVPCRGHCELGLLCAGVGTFGGIAGGKKGTSSSGCCCCCCSSKGTCNECCC